MKRNTSTFVSKYLFHYCSRCNKYKSVIDYYYFKRRPYRRTAYCKQCTSDHGYADNLRRCYKLKLEDFFKMIDAQAGKCACCRVKFPVIGGFSTQVDHCHKTGKIRGILCSACNLSVAHYEKRATIVAEYLKNYGHTEG